MSVVMTYSLAEVAAKHLPPEWKNPTRWLAMRLNRRELRGYRVGRVWRMRESDIDYLLERYSNDDKMMQTPKPVLHEPASIRDGISARARRRVRNSA